MNYLIDQKKITAVLNDIHWERVHVFFDIKLTFNSSEIEFNDLDMYAVNGLYSAKAKLKFVRFEGDIYTFKINITNNGENRCLPTGTYRLFVCRKNDILAECECDYNNPIPMNERSREFMFDNNRGVCAIDFFISEEDNHLPFRMRLLLASQNTFGFPKNPHLIHNSVHVWDYLKNKKTFLRNCYCLFRKLFYIRRKQTILFMTEQNDEIGTNMKAVYNRMIERNLDKKFNLIMSARSATSKPQSYKSWISLMYKMGRSEVIILDDHAPVLDWLKLSKDTKVIQLWHAGAGFKSSGYSRWGHSGCPKPQCCHRQYSFGIAGSKNIAGFFSEVWGINDEQVLPTGMPRMDEFLDTSYRAEKTKELYQLFPMCWGKKVVLFAPTYRGKNKKDAHYPYELIDFEKIYELCRDEYVVLFKMHPWVNTAVPIPEAYKDIFLDVNTYPNINDLFYITDLLITDYSSNIFEYSLMKKPMIFFAYDRIQYAFSRGFHRSYEESVPGKICYTFEELMEAFKNKDFEYEKVQKYIDEHFDYIDSHSSDRVIDWIILDQMPENLKKDIEKVREENIRMKSLDFTPTVI